ncbi:MAG: universal stress protein [Alphaproteobacteria bacterium]|jgi:nucleotide-binding universal stress UspA family protein|nr:universal stress protein [Alphaproteobacteria bacterium]
MYKSILLPIDLEDPASMAHALTTAVEYAQAFGAKLQVMTVVPDFGMSVVGSFFPDDFADKAIAETNTRLHSFVSQNVPESVDVRHVVSHGRIYEEIISQANELNADLIVMTAHNPDVSDYLLGSNAARVARHAKQSVLIVR